MRSAEEWAKIVHVLDEDAQAEKSWPRTALLIQKAMNEAAAAMRERAASLANDYPQEAWDLSHGFHDTERGYVVETSEQIKAAIRALPIEEPQA